MILLIVFLVLSTLWAASATFVVTKMSKRLLQFDDLFEMLADDISVNITYLDKLTSTATFSNSTEIIEAQRNMKFMSMRLAEYALRMKESTNRIEVTEKRVKEGE